MASKTLYQPVFHLEPACVGIYYDRRINQNLHHIIKSNQRIKHTFIYNYWSFPKWAFFTSSVTNDVAHCIVLEKKNLFQNIQNIGHFPPNPLSAFYWWSPLTPPLSFYEGPRAAWGPILPPSLFVREHQCRGNQIHRFFLNLWNWLLVCATSYNGNGGRVTCYVPNIWEGFLAHLTDGSRGSLHNTELHLMI